MNIVPRVQWKLNVMKEIIRVVDNLERVGMGNPSTWLFKEAVSKVYTFPQGGKIVSIWAPLFN